MSWSLNARTHPHVIFKTIISESESDATQNSYLTGYTNQVFSTLAEAQEECHKLSESLESNLYSQKYTGSSNSLYKDSNKSDCIGVTFVPSSYPFDQNTDPDFHKQSGYHIRKGPSLEDSAHSEITYLRKITPTVTMTKSMYLTDERNDSNIDDIWCHQQN